MKKYLFQGVNFFLLFAFMVSNSPLYAAERGGQPPTPQAPVAIQPAQDQKEAQKMMAVAEATAQDAQKAISLIEKLRACKGLECPEIVYEKTLGQIGVLLEKMALKIETIGGKAFDKYVEWVPGKIFKSVEITNEKLIDFHAKKTRASDFKLSRSQLPAILFLLKAYVLCVNTVKVLGVLPVKAVGVLLVFGELILLMLTLLGAGINIAVFKTGIIFSQLIAQSIQKPWIPAKITFKLARKLIKQIYETAFRVGLFVWEKSFETFEKVVF